MKVKIDTDKCILAGECYYNHPEVFKEGVDALPALVLGEAGLKMFIKQVQEAVEVCPSGAIVIED